MKSTVLHTHTVIVIVSVCVCACEGRVTRGAGPELKIINKRKSTAENKNWRLYTVVNVEIIRLQKR
jgi:F420-0:gamma-glutamyl ligase